MPPFLGTPAQRGRFLASLSRARALFSFFSRGRKLLEAFFFAGPFHSAPPTFHSLEFSPHSVASFVFPSLELKSAEQGSKSTSAIISFFFYLDTLAAAKTSLRLDPSLRKGLAPRFSGLQTDTYAFPPHSVTVSPAIALNPQEWLKSARAGTLVFSPAGGASPQFFFFFSITSNYPSSRPRAKTPLIMRERDIAAV